MPTNTSPVSSSDALNSIDLESMTDEELTAHVMRIRSMRTTNQLACEMKPPGRTAKKSKGPSGGLLAMLSALPDDEEEE